MFEEILNPYISAQDTFRSVSSLKLLRPMVIGKDRSLVFFVGAGASSAGKTGMPSTQILLQQLLMDALARSGKFTTDNIDLNFVISEAVKNKKLSFEATLNDLWQICSEAITRFFESFADLEATCPPNRAHAFLAYWLSTGGIVLTTNYDRLIEREWVRYGQDVRIRYREANQNSFETWEEDLMRGGCLFKLHGSFDDPESCLGALEHVETRLAGNRAALLEAIVPNRPMCFVGWRGADPDIPPLLAELSAARSTSAPTFWIHYPGSTPGEPTSLDAATEEVPTQLRKFASDKPILVDADSFFGGLSNWMGVPQDPNPGLEATIPDFSRVLRHCSPSGLARFVGIALRRANEFGRASRALEVAKELAETTEERAAAIQEVALLKWAHGKGDDKAEARRLVQKASNELKSSSDLLLSLNTDFGLLSMTVLALKSKPWLILRIPGLLRRYERHIQQLKNESTSKESAALHESLLHLYLGRWLCP